MTEAEKVETLQLEAWGQGEKITTLEAKLAKARDMLAYIHEVSEDDHVARKAQSCLKEIDNDG